MPRGDRTGPMGQGPMTGRRAGYCSGSNMPGFSNRYPGGGGGGFGLGRGFGGGLGYGRGFGGGGRGWRNRFYATGVPGWAAGNYPAPPVAPDMTHEQELALLKSQADALTQAMDDIHKRIDELEKGG